MNLEFLKIQKLVPYTTCGIIWQRGKAKPYNATAPYRIYSSPYRIYKYSFPYYAPFGDFAPFHNMPQSTIKAYMCHAMERDGI